MKLFIAHYVRSEQASGPIPAKKRLQMIAGLNPRHPHTLTGVDDYTSHPFADRLVCWTSINRSPNQ
jgi:hypothetical protein